MIHPLVLGTAGHIDHGKTALVRALTGIDTDRLPIEKARGITTELGFARLDLGERRIAVIDVPGHERFVKSMVAGATGMDLVCLVVAADEGVMPQTREHLDICDLLGVRRGFVVLTKRDLIDDEWLALVTADVRGAIAGTFLEHSEIVAVSTKTGDGLDALRAVLARSIDELPPRTREGVFRMPVDRVFTVKGFGTIVTGTILGGEIVLGDELVVLPSELSARVRGIEVHGGAVERAVAGLRAAINLGGVAVEDLARGDLLAHPGRVAASHILDVELRYLPAPRGASLRSRTKVLVHHGTAHVLATLALVGDTALAPGATALAQLRIDATTPLGAVPGDRFIVRGFSASRSQGSTIGGGRIVRVLAPKARNASAHAVSLAALATARLDQRLALDVRAAAYAGLAIGQITQRVGIDAAVLDAPLASLVAAGELLVTGEGDHAHFLHAQAIAELETKIATMLANSPDGISREALRTQLPAALPVRAFDAILLGLVERGTVIAVGERVARAALVQRPSTSELRIAEQLERWALEPLRPKEISAALGFGDAEVKAALDRLVAAHLAIKVKPDLYVHAPAIAALRARLIAFLDEHKTIDPQQWKELTGASRKFTIPLAEYFDAEKVTLRVGETRRRR